MSAAEGEATPADIAAAQVPPPGELTLDHVAHFVPDMDEASATLERLGFTLTPFSVQTHRLQSDGPLVPAGTANRCVMFERGYLELLTPTAETPLAEQLRVAMARYVGVHLVAFGTSAPQADHERLGAEGFEPLPAVALQRPIATDAGKATARFTVVRVPPGKMAEGRIQFCQQHTPELLWQNRWTAHRNGATGLAAVLICVAEPETVAQRYGRYSGIRPVERNGAWKLTTTRGTIVLAAPAAFERALGVAAPDVPWIAGYVLDSGDLPKTREIIRAAGIEMRELERGPLVLSLPQALGGIVVFDDGDRAIALFD